jgi:hypothetical protein
MDAYDLSNKVKELWIAHSARQSGMMPIKQHMAVMINTPEGYREVIGAVWNEQNKAIELVTDTE